MRECIGLSERDTYNEYLKWKKEQEWKIYVIGGFLFIISIACFALGFITIGILVAYLMLNMCILFPRPSFKQYKEMMKIQL